MKRKIHVIPHSHWDREWYFTTSRSKVYLMKDLKDVLDTLESDDEFKYFMLDAQASLLDDYLEWMPQDELRIKKLVSDKKLIIGPWYTQTDQMVISGESIVRNLYYGMKRCEELGGYMNVGYVPDSFGQAGNMPQIYKEFGIEDTLFWRGVSDDMVDKTDFMWNGDDGSKVFATQIPFGYYIGGNIPEEKNESELFWKKVCFEQAGARSSTRHIYFPNGFDQAPIRKNLPQIIKQRNQDDKENEYVISSIEDYIHDVKLENPTLEEVSGELLISKHMRIHKSIFSSRSDLKILNTKVQNYVSNILEPLLTISSSLGNEYPHFAIEEIWKLLFENAAHDSIGSCISDSANEDVYMRYKQANDIAVNLVELHSRLIATSIENKEDVSLSVFNTLSINREGVITCDVYIGEEDFSVCDEQGNNLKYSILEKKDLSEYVLSQTIRLNPSKDIYIPKKVYLAKLVISLNQIPSMGYIQLNLKFDKDSRSVVKEKDCLENEYYEINVNNNGSLNILDKKNNVLYKDQFIFTDNGDDGDSFNYSPPREDYIVSSKDCEAHYKIEGNDFYQKINIVHDMMIPQTLEDRAMKITNTHMRLNTEIELSKNSSLIKCKVSLNNEALSHRLCVILDVQIATKFNYADQQFGIIKRVNVYEKEMKLYEEALKSTIEYKKNPIANWSNNTPCWQEPPISIETMQSFVALCDDSRGMAVYPQGVREYEIIGAKKNCIRLTLFRSYGYMGKENLIYRPGRASGERIIETPQAQLLKNMEFEFGVSLFQTAFNDANISSLAKAYNTPLQVYQYADYLNGRLIFSLEDSKKTLPTKFSLMKTGDNLVVSSIKKCEDKEGYMIRLYNGLDKKDVKDIIKFNIPIKDAYYMDLKENFKEKIVIKDNTIETKEISHCKFITIYVQ